MSTLFDELPAQESTMPLTAWLRLIEQYAGMVLPEQLHEHFLRKINELASHKRLSIPAYYAVVQKDSDARQTLIEHVLIHESRFFRDAPAIEFVAQVVHKVDRVVSIWSAGCSTGEEVWSLAMHLSAKCQQPCKIVATDLSAKVINQALRRQYTNSKLLQIPLHYRQRFVKNLDEHTFVIQPDIDWSVDFLPFNLLEPSYPYRRLDVIFCQNVLIYFRQFERIDILNRMVPCLRLGGVIVLGSGEVQWSHPDMQRVDTKGILAYARIR